MLALESSRLDCATILLEQYKADPNKSNSNLSPLHLATQYGYTDIVKILLVKVISFPNTSYLHKYNSDNYHSETNSNEFISNYKYEHDIYIYIRELTLIE